MVDILTYLRQKRKYMSASEIARGTKQSVQAVSRKVKRMTPYRLEKKIKYIRVGKRTSSQNVNFYRIRR